MEHRYTKYKLIEQSSEFLSQIELGKKHIEELMHENGRCKTRINYLEQLCSQTNNQIDNETIALREKITGLEETIIDLNERYGIVQKENISFAEKYIKVEEHNNNLANLYIASYQLHSTLDFQETIKIVMEIIMNLVGSEEFALYLVDCDENMLVRVASEGNNKTMKEKIAFGEGIIGSVAETGESYYATEIVQQCLSDEPLAIIPLKIKREVIAVIAIMKLFVQKSGFSGVDHNLFDLLAGHAATAIFGSQLFSRSERKQITLKSFLDLIKSG